MEDELALDWTALQRLLPVCMEFRKQYKAGEEIDLHDAASKVAQAFGIEDLDAFAAEKLEQAVDQGAERAGQVLEEGFGTAFDDAAAQELAAVFAAACQPIASVLYDFAKGEATEQHLIQTLNSLCLDTTKQLESVLRHALGIPDEALDLIPEALAPYLTSIYCFAGALKIYQQAVQDARIARERRIEVERLCSQAVAQLKAQRLEMEQLLGTYMLDRLLPFEQGIAAMDQAVLDGDDDGFIAANAELWELFGRKAQYRNAQEFDNLMLSDEAFKL